MNLGARWAALRLGRPGLAGLTLLVAAAFIHGGWIAPRLAERDAPGERAPERHAATSRPALDSDAAIRSFRQSLPATASVPQWIGRIRNTAVQSGLALRSVDYKLERLPDSPILRYRITMPVTGSYAQARNFIGAVLAEVPALAVDDVQLKRDGPSGRQLEVRIRLSLFIVAG